MDNLITFLLGTIKDAPGYFALTVGFIAIMFALYIKVRSININEVTSLGRIQSEQVGALLTQVSQLSKDLHEARLEISRLYDKIDELEDLVRAYRNRLRDAEIPLQEVHSGNP